MAIVEWEGVPCHHRFTTDLDLTDGLALIARLRRGIDCPVCKQGESK